MHLSSSGFRHSTPGALAPVRVIVSAAVSHLIGPMRPTRRHISISPSRLIRDALAVRHTSTPRRPASGSVLSLAILCRHVALRDPGSRSVAYTQFLHRPRWPFDLMGTVSALPSPSTLRFSWRSPFRGLTTIRFALQPADLLPPLSEQTTLSPSLRGLLHPGFRRIGHPHRRRI